MTAKIRILTYMILMITGFTSIFLWIVQNQNFDIQKRLPGMDGTPDNVADISENVVIGEFFKRFADDTPKDAKTNSHFDLKSWSRFRGNNFDGIVKENITVSDLKNLKNKILWAVNLGEGHAGPVVYNEKVYILDYDETRKADTLRCFSLETGEEIWRRWYSVLVQKNHGMSRTVPAVNESYIVTIGPKCHVMCLDRKTGDLLWTVDLVKRFNAKVPLWYTGQCPLIDNDTAVLAPAGTSLVVGFDLKTGKILWETPNKHSWAMSHASVMKGIIHGKEMYVYSAAGGVAGISAMQESLGDILWETDMWNHNVVAPSPVILKDSRIFLSAGYGSGSMMIKINKINDHYEVEKSDEYKPDQGLALEQQTAIYYKDHLFGIMPNDAGILRNRFACFSPDNLRKPVWVSWKKSRYGLGPFMVVDDKFFILNDDVTLSVVSASVESYEELLRIKLFKGHDAWAPMAYSRGKLLLRDYKKMVCISIEG